ncbi:MAG: PRC-barrel domain-containing protein [Devosia sp.]
MKRSILIGTLAAGLCAAVAAPSFAAPLPGVGTLAVPAPAVGSVLAPVVAAPVVSEATPVVATEKLAPTPATTNATSQPAQVCLADLQALSTQMQNDGYWLGGSGYGYPMAGFYGYGYPAGGVSATGDPGYQNARPGYEVRTLIVAANILARQGKQTACEDVLGVARANYKVYAADMLAGGAAAANLSIWQQQQLASAKPITDANTSFRSDQLLGTDVRSPQNVTLGSVDDLVMSPQTGKIAYLVIARGGVFGFGQSFVPVPWTDFKATPNAALMVLDTTKAAMDGAPQVKNDKFATPAEFVAESAKVDAYWLAHQATAAAAPANG